MEYFNCYWDNDPTPPEGGGFLVLHPSQISNWDLVCAIKSNYPRTKILASKPLPTEANPTFICGEVSKDVQPRVDLEKLRKAYKFD